MSSNERNANRNHIVAANLVVFRVPFVGILRSLQPLFIFRYGEEINSLLSFRYPNDRCYELDKEIGDFEQRRVEMVQEVDEKALDMGAIVILHYDFGVSLELCKRIGP